MLGKHKLMGHHREAFGKVGSVEHIAGKPATAFASKLEREVKRHHLKK